MKYIKSHAAVKTIAVTILLLLAFSVVVSVIGYNGFTDAMLQQYADGAFLTAQAAARYIDADRMDEYVESEGKSKEYKTVRYQLDRLCNVTNSTFIYVIRPDQTDYEHITFIFSTVNHHYDYTVYDFGYIRQTTNNDYRTKYRALYEHQEKRELVLRDRGYIETDPHITAMIALTDSEGEVQGILCVQRQMDTLVDARRNYQRKVLILLVVLVLVVIFGESAFLHRQLLRPLQLISTETKRFSSDGRPAETKLAEMIRSEDEVGQLARSIDGMEEEIVSSVSTLTKITAEKERSKTEMRLAAGIQASMLPNQFPAFPDRHEFDIYATMNPAREVGGDFYDFFLIDKDHLCINIADVSGKGVPAAMFMMASKIILANSARFGGTPAAIMEAMNNTICSRNTEEMFVTVWLGILEISTGKLTAANAGHEYPILRQPGGSFELLKDKHGFVIGGMEGVKYEEYELWLRPGSKLFLYTDGVPEATNSELELFGTDRLVEALNRNPDEAPEPLLNRTREAVEAFVGEAEQFDDLTMVCLEYRGTAGSGTSSSGTHSSVTASSVTAGEV